MRCNFCGNQLDDNACICDKCGSFCGGNMTSVCSKKEYFQSDKCSGSSKKLVTVAWVLIFLLGAVLAVSVLNTALALPVLDGGETHGEVLSNFEQVVGAPTSISVETLEEAFADDVEECRDYFRNLAYTTVVVSAGIFAAVLLLAVLTVNKKSSRLGVWVFILCFLSNLIALAFGILLFLISRKWENEYRAYCINPSAFEDATHYNFS